MMVNSSNVTTKPPQKKHQTLSTKKTNPISRNHKFGSLKKANIVNEISLNKPNNFNTHVEKLSVLTRGPKMS